MYLSLTHWLCISCTKLQMLLRFFLFFVFVETNILKKYFIELWKSFWKSTNYCTQMCEKTFNITFFHMRKPHKLMAESQAGSSKQNWTTDKHWPLAWVNAVLFADRLIAVNKANNRHQCSAHVLLDHYTKYHSKYIPIYVFTGKCYG